MLVTDIQLVKQSCTPASVSFDDESVADFFDEKIDEGIPFHQFARIWIHTHPGGSPSPSGTDEDTFARVFGRSDWALMFIIAESGATYARLRFNTGPRGFVEISVGQDYSVPFDGSDFAAWEMEYAHNVRAAHYGQRKQGRTINDAHGFPENFWGDKWDDKDDDYAAYDDYGYFDEEYYGAGFVDLDDEDGHPLDDALAMPGYLNEEIEGVVGDDDPEDPDTAWGYAV